MTRKKGRLTFVNPIRYAVVDRTENSAIGYLIIRWNLSFQPIEDIILININQSVSTWCPGRKLKGFRIIRRRQCRLRSENIFRCRNFIWKTWLRRYFIESLHVSILNEVLSHTVVSVQSTSSPSLARLPRNCIPTRHSQNFERPRFTAHGVTTL